MFLSYRPLGPDWWFVLQLKMKLPFLSPLNETSNGHHDVNSLSQRTLTTTLFILPVKPVVSVAGVREGVIAAEVPAGTGIL